MTEKANSAVEQFKALLALERTTGTKTTRARNEVLRALTDADLIAVAVELRGAGLTNGTPTIR